MLLLLFRLRLVLVMIFAVLFVIFFFFKQMTAYELRISDWSSDVCSSDLCFTDHKAAAQCVVRIGFEGAIRHLLHAVDVKPEGEELDRRNGVNSQSYLL